MTSCCDVITGYGVTKIRRGNQIGGIFIYKIKLLLVFIRFVYRLCMHAAFTGKF